MAKRRKFSAEYKARLVLELPSDQRSALDIARKEHIKDRLLYEWRAQFVERAPVVFGEPGPNHAAEQQVADLEQLIGQLAIENEVLKKPRAGSSGWRGAATDGEALGQGL